MDNEEAGGVADEGDLDEALEGAYDATTLLCILTNQAVYVACLTFRQSLITCRFFPTRFICAQHLLFGRTVR